MDIRKVNVNGKTYEFVNESGNTRNGFYHKSTLFVSNEEGYSWNKGENKVSYLDRTWECYRYQTCMMGLVRKLIDNRIEKSLHDFKIEKGYSKMTDKRRAEFNEAIKNDKFLEEYNLVYKELEKSYC